jgi:predicted Zn-dependent peptidase
MNKTAFKTAAERIGTNFGYSSDLDYSEMNMTCVKPMWEKSWALFADAILNPAFNADEFALIRDQMVSDAKQNEADPDQFLTDTAMTLVFRGRGYERNPNGTSSSLQKLTVDDAKKFYKNTISKSHCILVVVGNLTQDEVTAKVKATLAKLPAGTAPVKNSQVQITQSQQNIIERDIATNYLIGLMSSPLLNSADGIPMLLATNILYDRLFIEIRTKRGLSYAPAAYYSTSAMTSPFTGVYASTDSPRKVIDVIVNELDDIKKNGFSDDELRNKKGFFLTTYLMGLETSASQSLALGRWAIRGDAKMYDEFTNKVNSVTLKDLNRVVDQNTNAIVWTYLGHKSDVQPSDFKQTTTFQNKPY